MSNSTTIVPIVLWGNKAPTHIVSVIRCTYDQKTIITGTTNGQLGLWDLRHTQHGGLKVVPRNLIFAHGAKILDIACTLDASYERPNIVSLAENGELCLWDIEDGLCLQINQIEGNHSGIHSTQISRGSYKEWRLVLYGCYSDLYVIDSLSLQVIYTLRSKVSPNWISAICTLRPARKTEDILVGVNVSCYLKVWSLKSSNESKNEVIFEEESKLLDTARAKAIRPNPFTKRTMLVISSNLWQVFDASDFNFLAAIPAPYKIPLVNGDFVATNRVLVWNKLGKAFLYKLPSRYLLGAEQILGKNDYMASDELSRLPTIICEFQECLNQGTFDYPSYFSYGTRGPYYKLLIQGYDGGICLWKVPDSEQADMVLSKLDVKSNDQSKRSEVTVSDEGVRKIVFLDEPSPRIVEPLVHMTLKELWNRTQPPGLTNETPDEHVLIQTSVTSSLYIPSQGKMVCGQSNGTIVVVNAINAAMKQLLQPRKNSDSKPTMILHGHVGHVTCLLYPHDENPRYDKSYLVSGGSDFTVRAWDIMSGTLMHTFSCHGGQVLQLMVTPAECNSRFLSCVCSVGQDHSVVLVGLRDRKVVLLASRHTFPIETIRWRAKDDFMVVGCSDGTVYVWQMETGHLDRCVAGTIAMEILESCNEETSAPSLAVREHHRKFKLHHQLTNISNRIPIDIKAPQAVRKMKNRLVNLHQQVTGNQKTNLSNQASKEGKIHGQAPLPPMRVCALRTNVLDTDIHVILLDPEALIRQLLTEEAQFLSSNSSLINLKHTVKALEKRYNTNTVSYEIAQLLLSCTHAWALDPTLDDICISKLGMLRPIKPLSFGLLTRGRLALMFPDWYVCDKEDNIAGALEAGTQPDQIEQDELNEEELKKIRYNAHWQLSSSLTTQHLVSTVAVTNTLMGMNYVSFNQDEKDKTNLHHASQSGTMRMRSEVKAGWSLLAALHCCMLPDAMDGLKYRPPLLHILARRWQDRCLEIREAAQALLLAELRRIGSLGRKQLIEAWSPHLPQDMEAGDFGFEDLEQYINYEEGEKQILVTAEEDRSDIAMIMMTTRKMVSSDIRLRHATAIIMLGVIGAEFQKEIDPVNRDTKFSNTDSCMDVNVVRSTAKALTTLLLQRQTSKTPAYSAIRRAAIDLIGRGFPLWEPHIDVSQVLMGFFELCADIENQLKQDRPGGKNFSISAAKDLHRSAKHSLSLIATARPSACITTLAKEVARHVAATSSMSFTQPSPAAIAVYSHVRHHPQSSGESQHSNILHNTRTEILRIMELMIDKNQQQVVEFIVEVVDIIVHMLDFKQMKERGLPEVFPSLFKFSMVAYCSHTRRLAVGSRLGHIVLYELRSSRCQLIPAHEKAITALAFSPEGKVLASFSYNDKRLSFYQTSSSLLGMLSSTIKCIQTYSTFLPDNLSAMKAVRILWTSKKNIVLVLGDGSQHKYSI